MRVLRILVLLSLAVSVGLNLLLWQKLARVAPSSISLPSSTGQPLETLSASDRSGEQDAVDTFAPATSTTQDNAESSTNKTEQLERLYALLREDNWPSLIAKLRDYLRRYPHDIEGLMIEAEVIARTEPLSVALVHYYGLLDLPLNREQRDQVNEKISQRFENASEQLRFERAWNLLAELLEPLVQIAPDERRYLVLLAEAYAQQANAVMMENTLAALPNDDPAIASIRQILMRQQRVGPQDPDQQLAELGDSQSDQSAQRVPLDRIGNQYMVDVRIDSRPLRLMLDTGASTTAITADSWARLNRHVASEFIGIFKVNTAAGFIQSPMFTVKTLSMGSLRFDDVAVMIIPSQMMGDDSERAPQGLLGMNILSQYDFRIDQQEAQLLLRPHAE
ncbi:retropepsin-like aspartic protease family protein [Alteromonas oceanisediminis]|uniref:retropepsin-like aspartic protease family protein n=1 Tax=Alteromonas oceanisediminis TaxID=2836180 RepID=UPI001BD9CEB6|nr:aspartyl protease family protein [Alteromonas oceanisediminis]MBT0587440.1 retroviral-like aspartic protease family protein [Alteromonas oceanisediminis]